VREQSLPVLNAKERDVETGLDYFGARYYASVEGRFTAVDSAGPDPSNPQTLNKYAYCLNNPLRIIDRDGRYGEDVHYDLTRVLAYAAGYSMKDATEIARETQAPDNPHDPRNPFNNFTAREMYHFTDRTRRQEMWDDFTSASRFIDSWGHQESSSWLTRELGQYMHALQDSYSHDGYDPLTGQGIDYLKGKDPYATDYTDTDPDKANRMAEDSFNWLVKSKLFVDGHQGFDSMSDAVSYNAIRGLVNQFNRASDRDKKREILKRIEKVARLARHIHEWETPSERMRMVTEKTKSE
jgi:RHS repeat-associated protein